MVSLPVRVELKFGEKFCRFTIANLQFGAVPSKGDPVDFAFDTWRVVTIVQYVHHLVGANPGSIIWATATFDDEIELVAAFDKFKDQFTIVDPDTGGTRPPSYYPAYRLLVRLWGNKTFAYDSDHPTAIAELFRACIMVGDPNIDNRTLNKAVETVHRLIIEHKQRRRSDALDLLTLMRDFDRDNGLCEAIGGASEPVVVDAATKLLTSLKSVPADKMPRCITGG